MSSFSDRTAFITGGAGGIGLSIARSLGKRGASVMLADIDADAAARAAEALSAEGIVAASVGCDVADASAVENAAREALRRFGKVHIVVNNAGVSLDGKTGEIPLEDWRWIVDINLMGVVNGVEIFTPLIRAHGEGGYIVNMASIAGLWPTARSGPYTATKFAVVGYSEAIRHDLEDEDIGVSVVCPGWVRTGIHETSERRPSRNGSNADAEYTRSEAMCMAEREIAKGLDPALVGEWIADSMAARRFYIFTHPDMAGVITSRARAMRVDYAACMDDPRFAGEDQ